MNGIMKLNKYGIDIFCWFVKGSCAAILLLVLTIFIGEGPPNPIKLKAREILLMVMFLAIWVGIALSLWRHLTGGIVILVSIAVLTIFAGMQKNWLFYAFWVLGLFNVLCGSLRRLREDRK